MKVVCQRCNTENRAIAKFCIECVNALPTVSGLPDFAPTEPAQPRLLSWKLRRGAPGASRTQVDAPDTFTAATRARRRLWLGVTAFVLALLVGAAGWLLAGALYISQAAPEDVESAVPEATASAPLAAAPVITPPVQAAAPAPVAAVPDALVPDAVDAAQLSRPAAPASTLQPRNTPAPAAAAGAKVPAAPASVSVSVQVPTPAPAPVPAARPRAAAEPGAVCAGMNFFSAARCMAEQCQDARFKAHPQCDAVRQQQRLDDERRNPLMAN